MRQFKVEKYHHDQTPNKRLQRTLATLTALKRQLFARMKFGKT